MATTAQQLTLFPGAPAPPLVPRSLRRPTAIRQCPILNCYTDLTSEQAYYLAFPDAFPGQAATVARNAFQRAGWLDENETLTEAGADVLRRAQALLAGAHPPEPDLDVPGSARFRIRRADRWRTVHLKCLLYLARSPGTAWRYLTSIFSVPAVKALQNAGLITGDRRRGAPQRITEAGLEVLRVALERAGVTYYLQAKTYD